MKKNIKQSFLALLLIICLTTGCQKEPHPQVTATPAIPSQPETETDASRFKQLPENIQKIMCEDGEFFDVELDDTFTKESFSSQYVKPILEDDSGYFLPDVAAYWTNYTIFDLDHDNEKELIFAIIRYHYSTEPVIRIFDNQDGTVYCYSYVYLGFKHLYVDGTIESSSGAADYVFYTLTFDKKKAIETCVAKSEWTGANDTTYYIGDKKVSEKKHRQFIEKYQTMEEVPWVDYEPVPDY